MLTVTARSSDTTAYSEFSQAVKTVSKEKFNYTYEEEVQYYIQLTSAYYPELCNYQVRRSLSRAVQIILKRVLLK